METAELRRRLGFPAKMETDDEQTRDEVLDDVLGTLERMKERVEGINRTLKTTDKKEMEAVKRAMTRNLDRAERLTGRIGETSDEWECREKCALIGLVLVTWTAAYMVIKIVP